MIGRTRRQGRTDTKSRQGLLWMERKWRMDPDSAAVVAVSRSLRCLLNAQRPFQTMSSVSGDRDDVQHLVVGDTGVFALETASLVGPVRVPAQNRGTPPRVEIDQHLRVARRGAALVRDRLRRRGHDLAVQPVLCLPFADLARPQYRDGVIVTRPEHLGYLIRHWPGQPLTHIQAGRVFAALQPRVHRAAA